MHSEVFSNTWQPLTVKLCERITNKYAALGKVNVALQRERQLTLRVIFTTSSCSDVEFDPHVVDSVLSCLSNAIYVNPLRRLDRKL